MRGIKNFLKRNRLSLLVILCLSLAWWVNDSYKDAFALRFFTPDCELPAPDAPSNLEVVRIDPNQVHLRWNDNSSTEYGFEIWRSIDNLDWNDLVISLGLDSIEYIDSTADKNFSYRVRAFNDCGHSAYTTFIYSNSEQITPTISPTTECLYDSALIEDITIPDNFSVSSNQPFIKTWRLKNTGSCNWTTNYRIFWISGETMNAPISAPLTTNVSPNTTTDLSIRFVAPSEPGTYQSTWQLGTPLERLFGSTFYVQITVPTLTSTSEPTISTTTEPTSTPKPTDTPLPTATHTPTPTQMATIQNTLQPPTITAKPSTPTSPETIVQNPDQTPPPPPSPLSSYLIWIIIILILIIFLLLALIFSQSRKSK